MDLVRDGAVLRAATYLGATAVVLCLAGFLRWVFVAPPLAQSYAEGDATTKAAGAAPWTVQHQFGGALLGEHLGKLLAIGWSITVCVVILRTHVLPRSLGILGLLVSALYLLNQGDLLATAVPGFPVWDLAGLLASTGWGLWVAALGGTILLRPRSSSFRVADVADDIPGCTPPQPQELSIMATSAKTHPGFSRKSVARPDRVRPAAATQEP